MSITADTIAYSSLRSKDHHKIIYSLVSKVSTDAIDKLLINTGHEISNRYKARKTDVIRYIIDKCFNNQLTFGQLAFIEQSRITSKTNYFCSWKVFRIMPPFSDSNIIPQTNIPNPDAIETSITDYLNDTTPTFVRCTNLSDELMFIYVSICTKPTPIEYLPVKSISCFCLPRPRLVLAPADAERERAVEAIAQALCPGAHTVSTNISASPILVSALHKAGYNTVKVKERKKRKRSVVRLEKFGTNNDFGFHTSDESSNESDDDAEEERREDEEDQDFAQDSDGFTESSAFLPKKKPRVESKFNTVAALAYANPELALKTISAMDDPGAVFRGDSAAMNAFVTQMHEDTTQNPMALKQLHFAVTEKGKNRKMYFSLYGNDVLAGLSELGVWNKKVLEAIAPLPHTDMTQQQLAWMEEAGELPTAVSVLPPEVTGAADAENKTGVPLNQQQF